MCILLGGKVPYILREVGPGEHYFLGECYVHGIMDGEAMPKEGEEDKFQFFTLV